METEGSGRGGQPVRTDRSPADWPPGAGGGGQPGHLRVEGTGPHTKGCESTNRGDSGNSTLNTRPDQDQRRETPDSPQGGRARPSPAHHWPAGLTPGPGDPGSDMLGICEMK